MKKSSKTIKTFKNTGDYIIGIDPGVASAGIAAVKPDCGPIKLISKTFEKAIDDSERRAHRSARRSLDRANQKQKFLIDIFSKKSNILERDKDFFKYISAGQLNKTEKINAFGKVPFYTTTEFNKKFPTYYHLIRDIVNHNIKNVSAEYYYIALAYMFKCSGNTYMNVSSENETLEGVYKNTIDFCKSELGINFKISNLKHFSDVVASKIMSVKEKSIVLLKGNDSNHPLISFNDTNIVKNINFASLLALFCGSKKTVASIFEDYKDIKTEISFKTFSDKETELECLIGTENVRILRKFHYLYNIALSTCFLKGYNTIFEAKIREYEENRVKLTKVRKYVASKNPEFCKTYFENHIPSDEDFFQGIIDAKIFPQKVIEKQKNGKTVYETVFDYDAIPEDIGLILKEILNNEFMFKLRHSGNAIFCNSLRLKDLKLILEAGKRDLPELFCSIYEDGLTVSECIESAFKFHVPYVVGPLNSHSEYSWLVRKKEGKIKYWNLEEMVDFEKTAENFILRLVSKCPYTGKPVLPKNSLLYGEFMVLNQLNCLKINNKSINKEIKDKILKNFFYKKPAAVSKSALVKFLIQNGYMTEYDILSGLNKNIPTVLSSYFDFKEFLDKGYSIDIIEDIILKNTVYGKSKDILKKYLISHYQMLNESDINTVLSKDYTGWGTLSKEYLTEIYSPNENGEAISVIDCLRNTSDNLSQLQSNKYKFTENADKIYNSEISDSINLKEFCDKNYYNKVIKKTLNQIENSLNELIKYQKAAPSKIFVEFPRFSGEKGKETESRLKTLKSIYKKKNNKIPEYLIALLNKETEDSVRNNRIFSWYCQLGRDIYSGREIEYEKVLRGYEYDIDHIKPRSLFKGTGDDSVDNTVLCSSYFNRGIKKNIYPLSESVRNNMKEFWSRLLKCGLISEIKFANLMRDYPITEEEISNFISSDISNTATIARATVKMLKNKFPNSEICPISAERIHDFKKDNNIIKIRDLNNFHHAHDAYLAAVVGNVFNECVTKRIIKHTLPEDSSDYTLNIFKFNTKSVWDREKSLKTVIKTLDCAKVNCVNIPKTAATSFYNMTVLPSSYARLPLKENMSVDRFGGFSGVNACYACLIEIDIKGKRTSLIHPVPIIYRKEFEKNTDKYFKDRTNFKSPRIIYSPIRRGDIVEYNGVRYFYKCTTNNRTTITPVFEFIFKNGKNIFLSNILSFSKNLSKDIVKDNTSRINNVAKNNGYKESEEMIRLNNKFISACKNTFNYKKFAYLASYNVKSAKEITDDMKEKILAAVNNEADEFMRLLIKKMSDKNTGIYFKNIVSKFESKRDDFDKLNVFDKILVICDFLPVINYSSLVIHNNILFPKSCCTCNISSFQLLRPFGGMQFNGVTKPQITYKSK